LYQKKFLSLQPLKNEPQTDQVMSKVCQLTGKQAMSGNNVSFSNRKTKRRFSPNLITKKFFIPEENAWISIRLSTSALKTINKIGISEALKRMEKKGHL
jgi:large subunit ribosomal protein L28